MACDLIKKYLEKYILMDLNMNVRALAADIRAEVLE